MPPMRWALIVLAACSGQSSATTAVCDSAPELTWDRWASGFFLSYCQPCHSADTPDRYGAPVGLDFDTERDIATWAGAIRRAVLEEGTMPVGGGVPEEDLAYLELYIDCEL